MAARQPESKPEGRRPTSSRAERRTSPSLGPCRMQPLSGVDEAPPHWQGHSSALHRWVQMLVSFRGPLKVRPDLVVTPTAQPSGHTPPPTPGREHELWKTNRFKPLLRGA